MLLLLVVCYVLFVVVCWCSQFLCVVFDVDCCLLFLVVFVGIVMCYCLLLLSLLMLFFVCCCLLLLFIDCWLLSLFDVVCRCFVVFDA